MSHAIASGPLAGWANAEVMVRLAEVFEPGFAVLDAIGANLQAFAAAFAVQTAMDDILGNFVAIAGRGGFDDPLHFFLRHARLERIFRQSGHVLTSWRRRVFQKSPPPGSQKTWRDRRRPAGGGPRACPSRPSARSTGHATPRSNSSFGPRRKRGRFAPAGLGTACRARNFHKGDTPVRSIMAGWLSPSRRRR